MTIRANFSSRYLMRYALIAVVCVGFALWCLYDGFIKYPQQLERAVEYHKLRGPDPNEWNARWVDICEEKGWNTSLDKPKKPEEIESDIVMQYLMAAVSGLVGLPFLVLIVRSRGRWMEATDTGIHTSWGQRLEFDRIVTLNKRKWKDKGIAKIQYEANGRKKRMVLDDYKYDRRATEEILRLVESKINVDHIVDGAPEPPREDTQATHSEGP